MEADNWKAFVCVIRAICAPRLYLYLSKVQNVFVQIGSAEKFIGKRLFVLSELEEEDKGAMCASQPTAAASL